MKTEDFQKISNSIPGEPGIYKFLDEANKILYVGKAKNLKKRLSSYFGEKKHQAYKTRVLVKNADHIDYMVVETEHDALLLENTLIKKFQPRYNVMLKDGKSYSYICIKNERFPRVFFTRKIIRDGSYYFGPYTSKFKIKQIFDIIQKLFPLRTCSFNLSEENIRKNKFKICLEYHIKNCMGPCEGLENIHDYNLKIEQVKNILKGNFKQVKDFIKTQMASHAKNLEFEKAHAIKEKLSFLEDYQAKSMVVNHTIKDLDVFSIDEDEDYAYVNYLKVVNGALINTDTVELKKNLNQDQKDLLRFAALEIRDKFNSIAKEIIAPMKLMGFNEDIKITIPKKGDKKKLLELSNKNIKYFMLQKKKQTLVHKNRQSSAERILKTLKEDLHMDQIPYHIECFDNSNIQGYNPVASCVVFKNAKPSKKEYRHYNIKTVKGPDDFASMQEVVYRRYSRLLREGESMPQLIIIDGGKGQLSSAVKSLEYLGLLEKIIVIGIAKRLEEIYFAKDSIPLYINKKSESLKLIQQARNEAHRFAIKFHRNQRSKQFLKTQLTGIPGIGPKISEKLLSYFGSVEKIRNSSKEEILAIAGPSVTKKILDYFS